MELNEYQKEAMKTCMKTSNNFSYMFLNLVGEIGEFSSKIAKQIRKGNLFIINNDLYTNDEGYGNSLPEADKQNIMNELGDCLWQLSGVAYSLGIELDDLAKMNLEKLKSRQSRGVIDGDGDNR